jgi:hypothetical protein
MSALLSCPTLGLTAGACSLADDLTIACVVSGQVRVVCGFSGGGGKHDPGAGSRSLPSTLGLVTSPTGVGAGVTVLPRLAGAAGAVGAPVLDPVAVAASLSSAGGGGGGGAVAAPGVGAGAGVGAGVGAGAAAGTAASQVARGGAPAAGVGEVSHFAWHGAAPTAPACFNVGVLGPGQWFGEKPLVAGGWRLRGGDAVLCLGGCGGGRGAVACGPVPLSRHLCTWGGGVQLGWHHGGRSIRS